MQEIAKGATELNVPIIEANRKLVASVNGGLRDPSVLVFNPQWSSITEHSSERFKYPFSAFTSRPPNDEDIAFMTVSPMTNLIFFKATYGNLVMIFVHCYNQIFDLGKLIKTKQITSLELTKIFMQRLKRYMFVCVCVTFHLYACAC